MSTIAKQAALSTERPAHNKTEATATPAGIRKQIVLCCDGTWNDPQGKGTAQRSNAALLFESLPANAPGADHRSRTIKYFDSGKPTCKSSLGHRLLGRATGLELDKSILEAYRFLISNYRIGDEIYLFGFSKGAYIVRSLAGLIRNCGILKPENIQKAEDAYRDYRDRHPELAPDSHLMNVFRRVYAFEDSTPIQFIGVWETVGHLGIPSRYLTNPERYRFHDNKLSSKVKNAFQALAVDENRRNLKPALWEISQNGLSRNQVVEQRWFAGSHTHVGGGEKDKGLSDIALNWLFNKALDSGLDINFADQSLPVFNTRPDFRSSITPKTFSLSGHRQRVVSLRQRETARRTVVTNESIDDSVRARYACEEVAYAPENISRLVQNPEVQKEAQRSSWVGLLGNRHHLSV